MIRIVIADDHTIMREGLKRILDGADDIEVVGEAVDGFEVLTQVRKGGFDLLMLDLSMPGRSGVCKRSGLAPVPAVPGFDRRTGS